MTLENAFALIDAARAALIERSDVEGRAHYIGGTGANGVSIDGPLRLLEMAEDYVGNHAYINRLIEGVSDDDN
ncbi:MAG TPA: hypothetical protein VFY10_16040 [Dehalococcoidia bacterium]|nr:hypothetical protein [Dehalococcoidia bacterium]